MLTMRPQPRSCMCGQTAWAQLNAPVRLTRRSRSHSFGCWSPNWPRWSSVPALLTRMSTEPRSSTVCRTASSTCARSLTSHLWVVFASSMSRTTTVAPARSSVRASARPSPREPPVTMATRPERSISITRHQQLTSNDEPLDLGRSLVDLEQFRVAHELLDRVLLHVPVAAQDLHGVGRHLHARVGGEALRVGRLQRRAHAVVDHPRRLPAEEARRLDLRRHVGDDEVDALVHRDRHAELDAFLRVLRRVLERGARDADRADRSAGSREVERPHGDLETLAF